MPVLELRGVGRRYTSPGAPDVVALQGIDLRIEQGEFVAIVGPSGGGKSTLMNILGLLDDPTTGEYLIDGRPIPAGESVASARLRASVFAFIFQSFHLLEGRPVRDSVELGLLYRGIRRRDRADIAADALITVGLAERSGERAARLSGGQRQRVAIARAIAADAPVVLADEPTGNLDSDNARRIVRELTRLNDTGATVIVVTHSEDVARAAHRRLDIVDGALVADSHHPSPTAQPAPLAPSAPAPNHAPDPARHTQPAPDDEPGRVRLRVRDVLADAWASVRSRVTQSVALSLAVAIAVALTLTTLGISTSAQAQVSSAFDAELNREVTATWDDSLEHSPTLEQIPGRVTDLAGIEAAAAIAELPAVTVTNVGESRTVQPHVHAGDLREAARMSITTADDRDDISLAPDETLIGRQLAQQLQLAPIDSGPIILVGGQELRVAGIIDEARRLPMLTGELLVSTEAAEALGQATAPTALILTKAGAAQQVARQVPAALNPYEPDQIRIEAPTDATQLRGQIEQGVQATLTSFTILALLVAIAALTNATLLAITARRAEIGMRKALGARSRHIAALIATESTYIGALGGIAGLVLGTTAVFTIAVIQRWAPVFDLRLAPIAVLTGLLIGALGGALASARAARLRPAETLRQ
jgi:macrolide transport system ATP-binding/permease protein